MGSIIGDMVLRVAVPHIVLEHSWVASCTFALVLAQLTCDGLSCLASLGLMNVAIRDHDTYLPVVTPLNSVLRQKHVKGTRNIARLELNGLGNTHERHAFYYRVFYLPLLVDPGIR